MSDFVTFFKDICDSSSHHHPLNQVIDSYSENEREEHLLRLGLYCKHFMIHSLESWIEYHHSLLSLLFLRKFYKKNHPEVELELDCLIRKGKTKGFGKQLQLKKGYDALICYLLDQTKKIIPFDQVNEGAILYRYLPYPLHNAEMGLIALYLGLIWNDLPLLKKGLKWAQFSLSLYDAVGRRFEGIWLKEKEFPMTCREDACALLFEVVAQLCPNLKSSVVFSKKPYTDPFIFLFKKAFQELFFPMTSFPLSFSSINGSLGVFRYTFGEMHAMCTLVGENTGVGCIHKKEVKIVSMGPHYFPLGDSDYYGIFRTSDGAQSGLRDVKIELKEDRGFLQGWTRLYHPQFEKRKNWVFLRVECKKERIDLEVQLNENPLLDPLFYVFFISAETAVLSENVVFYPAILDQYQGKVDKFLFKKGAETLTIFPHFEGEMTLIPLAGKSYFWSANFLLAFSLDKKLFSYRWTVN